MGTVNQTGLGWNTSAPFPVRLGVLGHVPHEIGPEGQPCAFEPYVREMRIWAELFGSVEVCSPRAEKPSSFPVAPYRRDNLRWTPVRYPLHTGLSGVLGRLLRLPGLFLAARRTIEGCDLVHLRSPGHFGLAGVVLLGAGGKPSITKWAGENGAFPGELLTSKTERRLLTRRGVSNPVLVYGEPKSPNQVSFLPALMSEEELARARAMSATKDATPPWRVLSVGRFDSDKGFDLALAGLANLARSRPDLRWEYTLVGGGVDDRKLRDLASELGIADKVTFPGKLPFAEVQVRYGRSHIVIMPGIREGWPKIIAESWAHGCVSVAARGGIVPSIIGENSARGEIFEPTPDGLARTLAMVMDAPSDFPRRSALGYEAALSLSLDTFKSRLEKVIRETFGSRVLGNAGKAVSGRASGGRA